MSTESNIQQLMSALINAQGNTPPVQSPKQHNHSHGHTHTDQCNHSTSNSDSVIESLLNMNNNNNNNNQNLFDKNSTFNNIGPINPLVPKLDNNNQTTATTNALKISDITAILQGFGSPTPNNNNTNNQTIQHNHLSPQSALSPMKISRASNKSNANETTIITKSLDEVMRRHYNMLSVLCRLCGEICGGINPNTKKRSYAEEIRVLFRIDIEQDRPLVHPQKICYKCRSLLDRIRKRIKHAKKLDEINARTPAIFEDHSDNCKLCVKPCPICFLYDKNQRPEEKIEETSLDDSGGGGGLKTQPSDGLKIDEDSDSANSPNVKLESIMPSIDETLDKTELPKSSENSKLDFDSGSDDKIQPKLEQSEHKPPPPLDNQVELPSKPMTSKEEADEKEANFGRFEKTDQAVLDAGNTQITGIGTKERHKVLLQSICRLCGGLAIKCRPKEHFGEQIQRLCGIDPVNDNPHIHPRYVCSLCCKKFYYRSSHVRPSAQFRSPIDLKQFEKHDDNCTVCYDDCPLCQLHPKMKLEKIVLAIDRQGIKSFMEAEAKAQAQQELVQKQQQQATPSPLLNSPITSINNSLSNNTLQTLSQFNDIKSIPLNTLATSSASKVSQVQAFSNIFPTLSGTPPPQMKIASPVATPPVTTASGGNNSMTEMQELLNQLIRPKQQQQQQQQQQNIQTSPTVRINSVKLKGNRTMPKIIQSPQAGGGMAAIQALMGMKSRDQMGLENSGFIKQETMHNGNVLSGHEDKSNNSGIWRQQQTGQQMQNSGITLNAVEFGKTTALVVKKFDSMVDEEKSLSQVIEKLIKRGATLKSKYTFNEGQQINFRGTPTVEDSQGMIIRAVDKLDKYVQAYRFISRAAAIEELIFSKNEEPTKTFSPPITIKEKQATTQSLTAAIRALSPKAPTPSTTTPAVNNNTSSSNTTNNNRLISSDSAHSDLSIDRDSGFSDNSAALASLAGNNHSALLQLQQLLNGSKQQQSQQKSTSNGQTGNGQPSNLLSQVLKTAQANSNTNNAVQENNNKAITIQTNGSSTSSSTSTANNSNGNSPNRSGGVVAVVESTENSLKRKSEDNDTTDQVSEEKQVKLDC